MSRGCVRIVTMMVAYAHIREKAFPTNVETMHLAHKEVIFLKVIFD